MPAFPRKPDAGPLSADRILRALEDEREQATKGLPFTVTSSRQEGRALIVGVEAKAGRRVSAIDESLEGCRAIWGADLTGRADVFVVNPDVGEMALRFVQGTAPADGATIWLYQRDFLTPLIDCWRSDSTAAGALQVTYPAQPPPEARELGVGFSVLRTRQRDAVAASLTKAGCVIGPPGTGKTFTVGAMVANQLTRFKNSRILLVGPTNVAVDTALLAADDWLGRLGRDELGATMKRLGSRFDARKYRERPHLLAPGVSDAALRLEALELEEPARKDIKAYVEWKERMDEARAALKTDISRFASTARVIALTTASLMIWQEAIRAAGKWHFLVCDEASQVMGPMALMLTTFATNTTFAGDPNQLSPIVQSGDAGTQALLAKTAFQIVEASARVQLNEQSRMTPAICDVIGATFYGGDLHVCKKSTADEAWKRERSPYYVDGREVPRIMFDGAADTATWSTKYNGFIRYSSAQIVAQYVAALLGSYCEPKDILILTPFRAQRALLRTFLKKGGSMEVRLSTIHRSQGSESKIVIFDPVDASSKFLNREEGMRMINVALSRAQAHAIVVVNKLDLQNPWLARIEKRASAMWHRKGDYAAPFAVKARV